MASIVCDMDDVVWMKRYVSASEKRERRKRVLSGDFSIGAHESKIDIIKESVMKKLIAVTVALMLLTGCQVTNQNTGLALGGAAGGLLGSQVGKGKGQVAAIIVGTIVGSWIGGNIGKSMDDVDRMRTERSLETMPSGATQAWTNPDSGNQYRVQPGRAYYKKDSTPCRPYTVDARIGGRPEKVTGTACRQADGTWQTQ